MIDKTQKLAQGGIGHGTELSLLFWLNIDRLERTGHISRLSA